MPADAAPAYSVTPLSNSADAADAAATTAARSLRIRASFSSRGSAFSMVWMSARISSVLIVSMSSAGETLPSTWTTLGSENARTTWQIAEASRMLARNALPRPWPFDAPRTSPAMSTNDTGAGMILAESKTAASSPSRASGSPTTPTFGSIVANG
jgi:hypothetical protein